MEFRFKIQDYQTKAVASVVSVFDGQPYVDSFSYIRDIGKGYFAVDDELGYSNAKINLSDEDLFSNIKDIQKANDIPLSEKLSKEVGRCSIDVEMETGTGKTYVYIKTMFELNKKYGWSKFIVVVPSIAIREGVKKSFDMTVDHFMEYYHKKARYFVYNSDNLSELDCFSNSADLSVMIINTQAFAASFSEGGKNKKALRIYQERDDFASRRPIDVIKANAPILILDEPQKMSGKITMDKLKNEFNPLFSINYSATHKKRHNSVFVLDALDAYNQKLVKKIEVKGFEIKNLLGTSGYLFLQEIVLSPTEPPKARIEFEVNQTSGTRRVTKLLSEGESIYDESNRMNQYKDGYFINGINPFSDSISLQNGIVLHSGDVIGDVSDEDIRRIQIRETIISHFDKEEELFSKGIKTLSLFFIDRVEHYRKYDSEGNEILGDYGKIFEEEYKHELEKRLTIFEDNSYQEYLREKCSNVSSVHNGYFSIDKKGHYVDSEIKKEIGLSDDVSAYDLILKNKERLLSFDEPTRFIFSHSALREGWDNPNIFQICTLKHSDNKLAQRQEVGRGLRICVDKDGNRMDNDVLGSNVFDINKLTVIASESYASFVSSLQTEMTNDLAERPRKANAEYYEGKTIILDNGDKHILSKVEAGAVYYYLIFNEYSNTNGDLTDSFKNDVKAGSVKQFPEQLKGMENGIISLTRALFDPSVVKDMFEDGRKTKVKENPLNDNFYKKKFQKLWNSINDKYAYRVTFNSDELIEKSIQKLNDDLYVKKLQYVISTGSQKEKISYEDAINKNTMEVTKTENKIVSSIPSTTPYDLVGEISKKTKLTRKTVVSILKELIFTKFELFGFNPEDFILQVSKIINEQKATMIVDHITYYPTGEKYDSSIFTAVKEEREHFIKCKKNVQDYVFPDGFSDNSVEKRFAESLEKADEVEVYAKLPRGFRIPTPVGNYAPDWAIAFKEGSERHIFFVAETKGSLDDMELRGIEEAKVGCAKILYNKCNTSDVIYDTVTNYQDLISNYSVA